jgi:hypothetical protein
MSPTGTGGGLAELQARIRDRAEYHLRMDAMRRLRGDAPATVKPYEDRRGRFWRYLFVPLYRRVPWEAKERAMRAARMTATGWTPPRREPSQPWQPPEAPPRP